MSAKYFICPSGNQIPISQCLLQCPEEQRCMFLPTLRAVAKSLNRKLDAPSITELLSGIREQYLKKITDYAVNLKDQLYAIHCNSHNVNIPFHEQMFTKKLLKTIFFYKKR